MKKLLFALPFVAGVSWAGTTLYAGSQTRDAYDHLIAQLNQISGLSVSNESYAAGFMSSQAITQVRLSDAADAAVLLRLQHDIDHSPVDLDSGAPRVGAARIDTRLLADQLDGHWQQALANFEGGEPFVLSSAVDFAGNTSNDLTVNPLHLEDENIEMHFDGAHLVFDYATHGRLAGTGTLGEWVLQARDGMRLQVQPATTEADLNWVSDGIYSGTESIRFPRFELTDASGQVLGALDDVSATGEAKIDDGLLYSGSSIRIQGIESPLPLNSGSMDFGVEGLSLKGLEAYQEVVNELSLADMDSLDDTDMASRMLDALKQIVAPGAGMRYAVSLSNDGGDADAELSLSFKGDGSITGRETLATVGDLLRVMTGELHLKVDAEALAMTPAPMLLASPGVSAYVLDDGVSYRADVDIADLIVNINGEPLSLELMLGDLPGMPLDLGLLSSQ